MGVGETTFKQMYLYTVGILNLHTKKLTRWWQLKYFLFSPPNHGEDESNLTSIFFRWVGKKPTNQLTTVITVGSPPTVPVPNPVGIKNNPCFSVVLTLKPWYLHIFGKLLKSLSNFCDPMGQ